MSLRVKATIQVLDLNGAVLIEASESKMVVHKAEAMGNMTMEILGAAQELHALVERVQASKDAQVRAMLDLAENQEPLP